MWERLQCGSRTWETGTRASQPVSFMRRQRPPRRPVVGLLVVTLQRPAGQETRRGRRPGTN